MQFYRYSIFLEQVTLETVNSSWTFVTHTHEPLLFDSSPHIVKEDFFLLTTTMTNFMSVRTSHTLLSKRVLRIRSVQEAFWRLCSEFSTIEVRAGVERHQDLGLVHSKFDDHIDRPEELELRS